MMKPDGISLNLASQPLRNRRLFYFLVLGIGFLFLVVSLLAGSIFFSYQSKLEKTEVSLEKINQSIREAQRMKRQYTTRLNAISEKYAETVDLINNLIFRKSFSWTEFLTCLEEALPDRSYIVSLAPTLSEDLKMKVRFRVVSRNVDDLLALINNLEELKFKQIKVMSESTNEQGFLISDVSLNYERTF
ncbi:MAG: hypothetical protein ACLFVG_01760 [Candidatus Aminicenantes bacterium]